MFQIANILYEGVQSILWKDTIHFEKFQTVK